MTPTFHVLKIANIRKETDNTVSISFDVPDDLKALYAYSPGQYLTLRSTVGGEDIRRSYSLCSAPHEGEWRVAIKEVEEGRFSTHANSMLAEGDELQVMTPMGNFTVPLAAENHKNYALFAAGSGITPVFSLAKAILNTEPESQVTLFYGNKGFASIIFREELEALKNEYIDRFRIVHVLSRESLGNAIQKGRIDADKCHLLHKAFLNGLPVDEVFVCGPEEMIHAVKDTMLEAGVPAKSIHFELFGTPPAKKVKVVATDEAVIVSKVTIIQDGDLIELALQSNDENILDAAHKAGADLPFACKGGVCCTCKAKILEGTARMDVNYALEPDEVAAGYILTCQAHPTSEKLIVSFDE